NATAPLRPAARAELLASLDLTGNPSSVHSEGRAARRAVERARAEVAALVAGEARNATFVASGTEAANLALTPHIDDRGSAGPLSRLIVSAGEHSCVLSGHRFAPAAVETAPLESTGRIDLDVLETLVARAAGGRVALALQAANNETGVIQPVAAAAALVHRIGGIVICDAVQLAGRERCDFAALGADFLLLSGHKLGGPKGAGALVAASDALRIAEPLVRGGGQERGLRAGTENVAAIAGFGAAARAALADLDAEAERLRALRDALEGHVLGAAPDAVVFGAGVDRLPNTLCFAIPGVAAETLLIGLDLAGFAVSSGAACSSGKVARSHVLTAMGVEPALAAGAVRLSLGWASTAEEAARFGEAFGRILAPMRRGRSAA
ncbi:MAG TPA: aminotransferase class V-fold PLP-dependent enzyme, partial [Roseiarcus sp.]|nr:aminotransferase class V-fold PLP-dependent enzyme [Roseiarcus sp.]